LIEWRGEALPLVLAGAVVPVPLSPRAYATGVYSSRRIARACVEDVAFRVLVAGEQPHFTTINQFRATHLEALSGLFVQVLKACQSEGL
jgi:transposase